MRSNSMNPMTVAARVAVAAAIVGSSLPSGCAVHEENAQALVVTFARDFEASGQCELQASGGQVTFRASGVLDLALTNRYMLYPSFNNNLAPSTGVTGEDEGTLRLNNNDIAIRGARVSWEVPPQVTFPGGTDEAGNQSFVSLPEEQFIAAPGFVEANGKGFTEVEIVPATVGETLALSANVDQRYEAFQLLVRLRMEGTLLDGTPVLSNEFTYPITVCRGCLIFYQPGGEEACCTLSQNSAQIELPCNPGQDIGYDCRACCLTAQTAAERASCFP